MKDNCWVLQNETQSIKQVCKNCSIDDVLWVKAGLNFSDRREQFSMKPKPHCGYERKTYIIKHQNNILRGNTLWLGFVSTLAIIAIIL